MQKLVALADLLITPAGQNIFWWMIGGIIVLWLLAFIIDESFMALANILTVVLTIMTVIIQFHS